MKLWLLTPVKPLLESKSRLSEVLPADRRADLVRRMLAHVLRSAQAAEVLTGMVAISRDPEVLVSSQRLGAEGLLETGYDLNAALTQGRELVLRRGADALLVLPADLPLLTVDDVRQLYTLALHQPGVVIAPSRDGGTSALLLRPPGAIEFAFGEGSFVRHCALAQANDMPYRVYESPTLAFDVDRPEDLERLHYFS